MANSKAVTVIVYQGAEDASHITGPELRATADPRTAAPDVGA